MVMERSENKEYSQIYDDANFVIYEKVSEEKK